MDIKSVNSDFKVYSEQAKSAEKKEVRAEESKANQKSDKLELSDDAKKLQPIVQKISSGFYNKPEVFNITAKNISMQFPPESK